MSENWNKMNYRLACAICLLGIISVYLAYLSPPSQSSIENQPQSIAHYDHFGSWTSECKQSEKKELDCTLTQKVLNDAKTELLAAQIFMVQRDNKTRPRLRIITPLGTFLPAGITIDLSVHAPFTVPFQFCTNKGCFINLDLADDVIEALQKEEALSVSYRKENRETQTVELSLSGLPEALKRLSSE